MLGRLKMSIDDCISAYVSLYLRVFRTRRIWATAKGQIQSQFDAEELAGVIKEVLKQQGLKEDALLKDESSTECKV